MTVSSHLDAFILNDSTLITGAGPLRQPGVKHHAQGHNGDGSHITLYGD